MHVVGVSGSGRFSPAPCDMKQDVVPFSVPLGFSA